jgi:hypothetical protein
MDQPTAGTARSILRIGPFTDDSDCAFRLQEAILDHTKATQPISENGRPSSPPAKESVENATLNELYLSNKYFTAIISLQDLQARANISNRTEDGVILVFDEYLSNLQTAASPARSTFNAVTSHFEALLQQDDPTTTPGDMLRLCVGVILEPLHSQWSENKEYEAEYSRRVLWCLDHGFEYVLAEISPDAVQRGHDERDKEGFARIVEAIHGTIWSSAVTKNRKKAAAGAAIAALSTSTTTPLSTMDHHTAKNIRATAPSAELAANDNGVAATLPPPQGDPPDADAFDEALQEARRIREVSQVTDLSDEARRKRASDAAKLVLSMMNEMGMDDDDEEEEQEDAIDSD